MQNEMLDACSTHILTTQKKKKKKNSHSNHDKPVHYHDDRNQWKQARINRD